jgi:hypothetical protein
VSSSKENVIFEDIFQQKWLKTKLTKLKKKIYGQRSHVWCILIASGAVAVARRQPHMFVAHCCSGVGKLFYMIMAKPVPWIEISIALRQPHKSCIYSRITTYERIQIIQIKL